MNEEDVVYVDISSNTSKTHYSNPNRPKPPKRHPIITTIVCCLLVVIILGGGVFAFVFFWGKGVQNAIDETMKVSGFDNTDNTSTVIYKKGGITVTYKGIKETVLGLDIKLLIDNETENKQTIQIEDFSIDRFAVTAVFSADVPSKKRSNKSITVYNSNLEENDISIDSIESAEFKLVIIKDLDYLNPVKTDLISVKLK